MTDERIDQLHGAATTRDALAVEIMRIGARLKEERLEQQLAELGMTPEQAIAAGYSQVTHRECCSGLGFTVGEIIGPPGPSVGRHVVKLCPCFGLEQPSPDSIVAAEYERRATGELLTGLEDDAALLNAMRRVPPPSWPSS